MMAGKRWILIVVGMLVVNVTAVVILIVTSSTHRSAVLPGYQEQLRHPR